MTASPVQRDSSPAGGGSRRRLACPGASATASRWPRATNDGRSCDDDQLDRPVRADRAARRPPAFDVGPSTRRMSRGRSAASRTASAELRGVGVVVGRQARRRGAGRRRPCDSYDWSGQACRDRLGAGRFRRSRRRASPASRPPAASGRARPGRHRRPAATQTQRRSNRTAASPSFAGCRASWMPRPCTTRPAVLGRLQACRVEPTSAGRTHRTPVARAWSRRRIAKEACEAPSGRNVTAGRACARMSGGRATDLGSRVRRTRARTGAPGLDSTTPYRRGRPAPRDDTCCRIRSARRSAGAIDRQSPGQPAGAGVSTGSRAGA